MIHVLVVEDSPTQTAQFRLMLEEPGFRVTTAVNGLKGLSAIQQEKRTSSWPTWTCRK